MPINLETVDQDGHTILRVHGEVDLYSSPDLRRAILDAIPKANGSLWIDLSDVSYMDSSGVATLVEGLKASSENKLGFELIGPSQAVMKVLQLSRLDSVFEIRSPS